MAIYVMSDIHGNYEKYIQALNKINLKDNDILFIIGDIVDRGSQSIKILQDMMYRYNVIPIIGNHEIMAYSILKVVFQKIVDEDELDEDFLEAISYWLENGGKTTFEEFKALSKKDMEKILDYLKEFKSYVEIRLNDVDYILFHAGLVNFREDKKLYEYSLDELNFTRTDYLKPCCKDKIVITGHTPVQLITGEIPVQVITGKKSDKIYKACNHIAIGCGYGNLGVLCLDTMEEIYV